MLAALPRCALAKTSSQEDINGNRFSMSVEAK